MWGRHSAERGPGTPRQEAVLAPWPPTLILPVGQRLQRLAAPTCPLVSLIIGHAPACAAPHPQSIDVMRNPHARHATFGKFGAEERLHRLAVRSFSQQAARPFHIFPGCDGVAAFAKPGRHQAEEAGHTCQICRDAATVVPHALHLLIRAHMDAGQAESRGLAEFARLERDTASTECDGSDGGGLHNDVQAELFEQSLLVEIALNGANFLAFDGDEICSRQRHRLACWRAAGKRAGIGAAHHPLCCDRTLARTGRGDNLKREVGESHEEIAGRAGQGLSRECLNLWIAIGSPLNEGGDNSGRIVPVPGIKVGLCNSKGSMTFSLILINIDKQLLSLQEKT